MLLFGEPDGRVDHRENLVAAPLPEFRYCVSEVAAVRGLFSVRHRASPRLSHPDPAGRMVS
ncbi:MAG: hypothetical protein EBY80_16550 [Actinobacteria bacterium]|nr:hypothetical protein [Actinomycetota bacterium]